MGKHAQLVVGPAGSGKSTYCATIQRHCHNMRRAIHVVNLDPAAENFDYHVELDVRDLISLNDVMEELSYGPNGGLVYCMEYLADHLEWLEEGVAEYGDDYLIFDCPGQIELYLHLPVMKSVVDTLQKWGYNVCVVHLVDSLVITDSARLVAGTLMCLSAMVNFELPHVNVLSKCDLVEDKKRLENFLEPDSVVVMSELNQSVSGKYAALNEALTQLIEEYAMVSFLPFDRSDQESIDMVLSTIDHALQYGEDLEPKEPKDNDEDFEHQDLGDGDGEEVE